MFPKDIHSLITELLFLPTCPLELAVFFVSYKFNSYPRFCPFRDYVSLSLIKFPWV